MVKEVDARSLPCPQPVIKTKDALEEIEVGERIKVIVDNEASLENIKKFLRAQGHLLISEEKKSGEYILLIEKGSFSGQTSVEISCDAETSSTHTQKKPKVLLILATDHLGKDPDLGRILLKGFFETMLIQNMLPQRIFLMNSGVFLTTKEETFINILKEFENRGVEIFTCGTCLKYYQLEDSLQVGLRGGTDTYLEALFQFEKVIFID